MLATLVTAVISGLRGELVRVEVDVAPGLPICHIVGLPDTALSEARERVRSAIRNSGFDYPLSRITVNLAPADRRKHGAAYDLAIAVGILVASEQIRASSGSWALLGELSLGGAVRTVPGVLPMVATLARKGIGRVVVPAANLAEAQLVAGVQAVGIEGLDDAARLVAGPRGRRAAIAARRPSLPVSGEPDRGDTSGGGGDAPSGVALEPVDLADVRGQRRARWATEVAIAGAHNILLIGPPGAGKTLLARTVPTLLPPLGDAEALEVTVIESVAGLLHEPGLRRERPFRAPHHTTSYAALVGGGPGLRPGEVTLAHHGVLFLDELAEFDRDVLDALRQPLEDGVVEVSRARGQVTYPARVQLIAAMNPCRCGYHGDAERPCRCSPHEPERYVRRVSGPLVDRFDLRVEMPRVPPSELVGATPGEDSRTVRARILEARAHATARGQPVPNARLRGAALLRACHMTPPVERLVADLATRDGLSGRGVHRVLRVALTIADLAARDRVEESDLLAAAGLRDLRAIDLAGRMNMVAERVAWVALASVDGVGDVTFTSLVGELGGAATVLTVASRGRLAEVRKLLQGLTGMRIPLPVVEGIRAAAADPGAVELRAAELGVWTVTPLDPAYPPRLRELDPAPAVLWGMGSLDAVVAERSVAVVGTRRPTLHGRSFASRVATRLVECECVVISGLAIGIDGAAQAATVEAGGRTVAVLGAGHARPGPRAHRWLVERILAGGGALVWELAPDVGPTRGTFPRRNRIISILSAATIVIEAPARSGALITARLALEQGRPVLAAPGRPYDPATAGCLALLRDTPARPLVGLDEMVVDLGLDVAPDATEPRRPTFAGASGSGQLGPDAALRLLGPPERAVAERLRRGPASADALIDDTGLPPAVASGAITLLLLRGWAQQVGVAYLPAGPLLRTSGGNVS